MENRRLFEQYNTQRKSAAPSIQQRQSFYYNQQQQLGQSRRFAAHSQLYSSPARPLQQQQQQQQTRYHNNIYSSSTAGSAGAASQQQQQHHGRQQRSNVATMSQSSFQQPQHNDNNDSDSQHNSSKMEAPGTDSGSSNDKKPPPVDKESDLLGLLRFASIVKNLPPPDPSIDYINYEKPVIYKNPEHYPESFPTFESIRRLGKLCDVTLKVDDQSFSAHRLVLAATIPYFHGMFLNDMAESKQKCITLQGFDSIALESFINYAYTGHIVLNNSNVQSIMVGAAFLGLPNVKTACADFLHLRINPNNVIGIRNFADMLSCAALLDQSTKYIQRYFEDVSRSDEFLGLGFEELRDLVACDELNVSSEKDVFEAVTRWIKHDCEHRSDLLAELMSLVGLPLLPPEYLVDTVAKEELVRTSHECRDLLDEAKDYHLIPNRRDLIEKFRVRPRCNYTKGYIFAVGGLTKFGDSLSTVEVYDPFTEKWEISEPMTTLRSRVGVSVHKNKVYAFGGYNGSERLRTVEVYDPAMKNWKIVSSMHCKRSAVGTASLSDYIYICGGYDGVTSMKTVERYCPETDRWDMVASMNRHRSAGGVVAFQGYIYALGGHDGLSIYDSVERYDPRNDTWTLVKPMLTRRCRLGVATLNGKLYVCGGYDGSKFLSTVEAYDARTDTWEYVAPMKVTRSRAALVANMGKLWAIGGYDGFTNLSTVEVYDPVTNAWTFASSMYAHEGGVGVGVILQ